MKVTIHSDLDIDALAWAEEYGVELSDVWQDVREYVRNGVSAQLAAQGLLNDSD